MAATATELNATPNSSDLSLATLTESEKTFRKLVETLPDAILVHCDNKIVFVNPFFVRLLGAESPEQLLGRDIFEIIHFNHAPTIENVIQDCQSTGIASPPTECTLIACDGSSVEVEGVGIPMHWKGSPAIEVVIRDVRKRKHAERAAQEWQQRLELAQKAGLRIGLWDWDIAANTVVWSDETYRQFGFTRDTFSGRVEDALDRLHPEDRPKLEHAIKTVIGGAEEYACQYRLVCPDGSICWIDAHGVIVRNGSTHMLGIGIDITDLKKTQESVQESEEKYLLLLNSTAEAIYGLDLDGNCTFCNPSCLRLMGYQSQQELLGKNMHALMHHTRADGTAYPEQNCQIYIALRESKASHTVDEVLWRADGSSFPAEYWSYPMYKAGKLVGAVVTILDISERKQAEQARRRSEEKHRQLFENTTYGIFRSLPDGTLLDANPALVTMLGYSSKEELLRCNLNEIYQDPKVRATILARYGGGTDGSEARWKRKDGKIISIRLRTTGARVGTGPFKHFDVIVEDITEQQCLEEQLRQAHKMEAIGLLAGGISHDFNNLLNVILGNSELLLITAQSEKQQHYAQQIQKATERATQLTRQLLAFSRKQVLRPANLDLNAVVLDVGKILQRLIGEDIRIVTDLAPTLGAIKADRGQIEQILMNLATNARDAMPGGGTFTVRTENMALKMADQSDYAGIPAGEYIRLSVRDTGVGMSEEVRIRIFEPFFTTKSLGHGTGLGLSTVYGIVDQSNGFIRVSSALAMGTTFDIYLPRVAQEAAPPVQEEANSACPRGTETILLLEDEEALRKVTCEFLTGSGYHVLQAGSGSEALALAEQYKESIALIVSDVILPDITGPATVAKLQALHPEIKAMYVSGYAEVPVSRELIAQGATLLHKPLPRRDFLKAVHEILHRDTGERIQ